MLVDFILDVFLLSCGRLCSVCFPRADLIYCHLCSLAGPAEFRSLLEPHSPLPSTRFQIS